LFNLINLESVLSQTQIESAITLLKNDLLKNNKDFFNVFPIEFYIDNVKSYSVLKGHKYISPELNNLFRNIKSAYNIHVLAAYHKLALIYFLKESIENISKKNIPASIHDLTWKWFERVFNDISSSSDEYYNHGNDSFLKDLEVCSQKAFPVGGAWIAQKSRIRITLLFNGGLRQFFELFHFILFRTGGFSPFYALHTCSRYLDRFNPEGRDLCYTNVAQMLKLNPDVKGMSGESWFNDPNLDSVSPRLAYLRKRPVQNGAKIFKCGTDKSDIDKATAKSYTRNKLYKEGKYMPTCYVVIWPRKNLIEWADEVLNLNSG